MSQIYGRIYCVTNTVNGKQYVGKTTLSIRQRWNGHCKAARNGKGAVLQKAIKKYGVDSFTVKQVAFARSAETLNKAECSWIFRLRTLVPHGYNLGSGGDGGNWHSSMFSKASSTSRKFWSDQNNRKRLLERLNSPEVKARREARWLKPEERANASNRSKATWANEQFRMARIADAREMWADPTHRVKVAEGQAAARKRMSDAAKRHWADPDMKARMLKAQRKANDVELRARRAKETSAKWLEPEYRNKQLAARLEWPKATPEFREKMRVIAVRMWESPGHRAKVSAGHRRHRELVAV